MLRVDFDAIEHHRPGVTRMHPGNHLDQGGFARPVFPQKGMNFTTFQVKIDILQRLDPGKEFSRTTHRKYGVASPVRKCGV